VTRPTLGLEGLPLSAEGTLSGFTLEAAREVQNEQPLLLVDLQSVLVMLGEWVQLMREVYVEVKQSWVF